MVPEWMQELWKRVILWIRIPKKNRSADHIEYIVRKSLTSEGFEVHAVDVDYNRSQDKYYVRPIISGTCKSTRECVEVLVNGRAGEIRLDTGVFVYQRDNTCNEPLFDRLHCSRRRIRPLRQTCNQNDSRNGSTPLYSMVVLPPDQPRAVSRSKTLSRHTQKSPHGHMGKGVSKSLPIRRRNRSRAMSGVHSAVWKNTQDAATYRTSGAYGSTSNGERNIYTKYRKMRHHRSSRRHTFLPLCGGRRLVSAVC